MKYYSDTLNKIFDTVEALETAEAEYNEKVKAENKLKEERKARAKEIEEVREHYYELVAQFIEDYGSYHTSYTKENSSKSPFASLMDLFR